MRLKAGLSDTIMGLVDGLTIDDVLRCLIKDSDLVEVVSCLDMIAEEDGKNVAMFKGGVRLYPVPTYTKEPACYSTSQTAVNRPC